MKSRPTKVNSDFSMLGDLQSAEQNGGFGWTPQSVEGLQPITRADTLELNPVCVNPGEVIAPPHGPLVSAAAATTAVVETSVSTSSVSMMVDPNQEVFTYPLHRTVSGSQLLRTPSGQEFKVVESIIKEEITQQPASVILDPSDGQVPPPVDDTWSDLVELNNEFNLHAGAGQAASTISATGANPATKNWSGDHGFAVRFEQLSENTKNKSWTFSPKMNKLFIDQDK